MLSTFETAMKIKEILAELGFKRIASRSEMECEIIEAYWDKFSIIISVMLTTNGRIAVKVVRNPSSSLLWGCEGIKYDPNGLYLILENEKDLKPRLRSKLEFLGFLSR